MLTPERTVYVPGLGASTLTVTWDQAALDLNNKVGVLIAQGDLWAATANPAASDLASAVYAYQQAGAAGATTVGPEIDSAGRPEVTQKYTQQAWTTNAALAAVNGTHPSPADVDLAAQYAKQMYAAYQTAIALGKSGLKSSGEVWRNGVTLGVLSIAGLWVLASMRHEGTFRQLFGGGRARHR